VTLLAACRRERSQSDALPIPGADGTRGLAKVGTRLLRRAGIDVVAYGNAPEALGKLDSTRIVVRRGTEAVGQRVRRALGRGRVVVQLDSARLLDASVLLGADVAPRSQFHP